MKKYYFGGFLKTYSIMPYVRYITQCKESRTIGSCFRDMVDNLDTYFAQLDKGVYIALTHEIAIKRIRRSKETQLIVAIFFGKGNINNLKKYIVGDKTKCRNCQKKSSCKVHSLCSKDSGEKKEYIVVFLKERERSDFK